MLAQLTLSLYLSPGPSEKFFCTTCRRKRIISFTNCSAHCLRRPNRRGTQKPPALFRGCIRDRPSSYRGENDSSPAARESGAAAVLVELTGQTRALTIWVQLASASRGVQTANYRLFRPSSAGVLSAPLLHNLFCIAVGREAPGSPRVLLLSRRSSARVRHGGRPPPLGGTRL